MVEWNTNVEFKVRHLQLNQDNSDKAPNNPIIGNPLTKIAEDMTMFSVKIQHSYQNWRYTVGSDMSKSSFEEKTKDNNDVNFFLNIEYYL